MPWQELLTSRRFINNEFVAAALGKAIETINPATEEVITSVHEATEIDIDIVVKAARKAFEGTWSKVTPQERGKLLLTLSILVEKNLDLLSSVEALDNGKPLGLAKGDVLAVAGCFRYYGGWVDKIEGKVIDINPDTFSYTRQEPVKLLPIPVFGTPYLTDYRLAFAVKLSHGTSIYSCLPGRLAQLLLLAIRLS
jgi:acyl-CoA reductase-like NAD-dependent aldehyde dehydrogenase